MVQVTERAQRQEAAEKQRSEGGGGNWPQEPVQPRGPAARRPNQAFFHKPGAHIRPQARRRLFSSYFACLGAHQQKIRQNCAAKSAIRGMSDYVGMVLSFEIVRQQLIKTLTRLRGV